MIAKNIKIRKIYNNRLRDALNQHLTHKEAWQLRRALGAELKENTSRPFRDMIYARNRKKYGDPLGPSFEKTMEKNPTVEKILTDTNSTVNTVMKIPEKPLPYGGAVVGGMVGNSIGGSDECGCSY